MQREVEALLIAYLADRNREARLVQDLLTAIAVGSAARQRMLQEIAAAVSQSTPEQSPQSKVASEAVSADITNALTQLRSARGSTAPAH